MASSPPFPLPGHSNVYLRGFPLEWGEAELLALCRAHGPVTSIRVVAGEQQGGSAGTSGCSNHAFVKYELPEQAGEAIQALNGATISGCQLVVKFADADVQPRVESGRQPSEWCYCRNLPPNYSRQDVGEMFLPFGTVLEIRLFPSTELYKGSGALVQMQSVDQAAASIQTLNGSFPRGASQPLLVRYADSPAEKAAKQARKERLVQKQTPSIFAPNNLLAAQLQQQLLGLAINGNGGHMSAGTLTSSPDLSGDLPSVLLDSFQDGSGSLCSTSFQQQAMLGGAAPSSAASIYIKGMPETADKLWLYEKFARFGGIASVRVLIDEQSGKCNGIGFVNYVSADAARLAQESMNGISMGDRLLHVLVQNPAARSRSGAQGMSPTHSFSAGSTGSFQQSSRQQPVSAAAMHAAAANLGFNASALATLQAGFIPQTSATGSTSLHSPNGLPLSMSHGGYGSNMGSQHLGSFSQLQW